MQNGPAPPVQHTKSRDRTLYLGAILAIFLLLFLGFSSVHHAAPNEWLLVVNSDGEQTKAVVGGSHIASPWERVVRFPSNLQKVSFKAQQVTREMQGIEVSGFASWVVYREEEGPLKAFRHLNGLTPDGIEAANDSLRDMAESILRAKLANLSIAEVLTSRELLRDVCRKSMMEVVRGWGVWIETLEVTDVKILSSSLFNNLQTTFREETRLAAEMRQLETQQQISERRLQLGLKKSEQQAQIETQQLATQHQFDKQQRELETARDKHKAEMDRTRFQFQAEQDLLLPQEKEKMALLRHELAVERAKREHQLQVLYLNNQLELNATESQHARELAAKDHDMKMKNLKEQFVVEHTMSEDSHRVAQLEAAKHVFGQLPLHDVKLVNFGGLSGANVTSGDMGLLPGLWAGVHA